MIIELLELYIKNDQEIWIADGVEVAREFIIGKYIQKMIVSEYL